MKQSRRVAALEAMTPQDGGENYVWLAVGRRGASRDRDHLIWRRPPTESEVAAEMERRATWPDADDANAAQNGPGAPWRG